MDSEHPQTDEATPDQPEYPTAHPSGSRPVNYAIYKPNGRGTGGVIRFELSRPKAALFVDAASQSGDKQFDWERKITMKWGLADIGQALAVLQRRQPVAKLFHQSEKANSTCELARREEQDRSPYLMAISRQENADRSVRKVAIPLTHADAALLEAALRAAVIRLLNW